MLNENIKNLLLIGWGAGGDPETAMLVAKANRLKRAYDKVLKCIKEDCDRIGGALRNFDCYSTTGREKKGVTMDGDIRTILYCDGTINYPIEQILANKPMELVFKPISGFSEKIFLTIPEIAWGIRCCLLNKMLAVSVRIEYGENGEFFLITPKTE